MLKPHLLGDLDRLGRPVRRRGPDHHDRRRVRLADRAAFRLTAAERKTLLVAGAAAGMSATFGTPIAATLLAVELLLFEWKPRSLDPGRARERDGGGHAPLPVRPRAAVPGRRARGRSRPADALLGCVPAAWPPASVGAPDRERLRVRGPVPAAADPLDVVARDRRARRSASAASSSRARSASATT